MKLVLCSEGFRTRNTVQACVELVGKPQDQISVAVINEAYAVEESDKYWTIKNLHDVAVNFKGGLDLVNLLALSLDEVEQRLMQKDVIFVVGGNMDYLMRLFDKTGFSKLLPRLLETKVYIGSSAGSIVLGKRLPTAAYSAIYGGSRESLEVDKYLELVDFAFLSHLNSTTFPNNREEVLVDVCANVDFPVYSLQDDSAIVVNDAEQTFIGSEPVKIINTKSTS
jgi:dipeptidase E